MTRRYVVAMAIGVCLSWCGNVWSTDVRYGHVTEMKAIENRGSDESQVVKERRNWGRMLGAVAKGGASFAAMRTDGAAGMAAGSVVDSGAVEKGVENTVAKMGDQGPTTRFMVKVRMDSGKVLTITQLRQDLAGIDVGQRVRVEGKGDAARVKRE